MRPPTASDSRDESDSAASLELRRLVSVWWNASIWRLSFWSSVSLKLRRAGVRQRRRRPVHFE